MAKTTQNDIKIDVIGFFMELAAEVEKTENVTLDPILLKSLENIKKEYEIPYDQRNIAKSIQRGRNESIVEKIKAKTENVGEVAKDTKKGKATQQEIQK